jgi:hypothetical protein
MTDEPPALPLIALGDPAAGGLCTDGVCVLPSTAPTAETEATVPPEGAPTDQRPVTSAPPRE